MYINNNDSDRKKKENASSHIYKMCSITFVNLILLHKRFTDLMQALYVLDGHHNKPIIFKERISAIL